MPKPIEPELRRRGQLVRSLGAWREMLPGSLVEVHRRCGKPTCRCAGGVHLHRGYQLSVLWQGRPRTFHVPMAWVEEVRAKVEMARRFHAAAAAITEINLRRFLRRKQEGKRTAR